jgi:hypothetical protein
VLEKIGAKPAEHPPEHRPLDHVLIQRYMRPWQG